MSNQILDHDDLSRTVDQMTALMDMIACNPVGFRLLHESSQESLLCLADDLAYQVQAALSNGKYSRIDTVEDSSREDA